jgi:hypothetical protein
VRKKILSAFKLNRRKGIKELSKFLINEVANKHTKILYKHLQGVEKSKQTVSKVEEPVPCSKNYTVDLIK